MGAPGRKYVEKMIEGVTDLDLSGGTLLYKRKTLTLTTDTTLTTAQSGMSIIFGATGLTASLPQANAGNTGVWYQFSNGYPSAATADLKITSSAGSGVPSYQSVFVGTVGDDGTQNTYASPYAGNVWGLQARFSKLGDIIEVVCSGDFWAIQNTNISGSAWTFINE